MAVLRSRTSRKGWVRFGNPERFSRDKETRTWLDYPRAPQVDQRRWKQSSACYNSSRPREDVAPYNEELKARKNVSFGPWLFSECWVYQCAQNPKRAHSLIHWCTGQPHIERFQISWMTGVMTYFSVKYCLRFSLRGHLSLRLPAYYICITTEFQSRRTSKRKHLEWCEELPSNEMCDISFWVNATNISY